MTLPRAFCLGLIIFTLPAPSSHVCVPVPLAGPSLKQKLLPDQVLASTERAPSTRRVCARGCEGIRINGATFAIDWGERNGRQLTLTATGQMPQGGISTEHQWDTRREQPTNSEEMTWEEREMRQLGSEGYPGFSPGRRRGAF